MAVGSTASFKELWPPLVAFDEAVVVAINTESKYRWMAFMWREITVMTDQ